MFNYQLYNDTLKLKISLKFEDNCLRFQLNHNISGTISSDARFNSKIFFQSFSDIDECETSIHSCDVNAFCNNTIGSYICTCNPGYFGNGKSCLGKTLN